MILTILKIIFLFMAVAYSFTNIARIIVKQNIPPINVYVMSIGIVGFIVLQFKLF